MNNPDDYKQIAKDIATFSVLGSIAMIGRILASREKNTVGYNVRRTLAGGIVATFVGFAVQDYIQSQTMIYAAVGITGSAAPEIIDSIVFRMKDWLLKTRIR
jgi:hypothetical protein